jgi:DNA-binding CsgD family transcriptional regulator
MNLLSLQDIQKLNQGIQQLYALHDFDSFGVDSLQIVNRLVPSDIPVFHLTNTQDFQIKDTFLPEYPGLTPELIQIKIQSIGEHPIAQNMSEALTGACKISDFLSQEELHFREGIYQQFLRIVEIEDQMMLFLPSEQSDSWNQLAQTSVTLAGFALNRSQRTFTERDRLILNLLRPHLTQTYRNAKKNHQIKQELTTLQQSIDQIGMVIIDGGGFIKQITGKATSWLDHYFIKSTSLDRLPDRLWSWVAYRVANLTIGSDPFKAFLPLCIEQGTQKLVIRLVVEPDRNQCLLLLEEQTQSSLKSLEYLGLSQRETEVLGLVMQGKDNRTIATHLGVGPSTIRKHLENTYRKFGVQSRTEAIAYALQQLGVLS